MSPRSAPYLWVQLINGGALPLEGLLLLLLLAGADPGPLPALEVLLAWALGAAAPALLLWQRPADPRSLLLLRGTGPLSSDQGPLLRAAVEQRRVPRVLFAAGVVALLPLLRWLDGTAALASQLSPLQGTERLVCLLAASGLLALMVWQWQQLVQAIWLLSHNQDTDSSSAAPAAPARMPRQLGLPLLRWPPLVWPEEPQRPSENESPSDWIASDNRQVQEQQAQQEESATEPVPPPALVQSPLADQEVPEPQALLDTEVLQSEGLEEVGLDEEVLEAEVLEAEVLDPLDSTAALPVEPEQSGEHEQGHDLDQQVG